MAFTVGILGVDLTFVTGLSDHEHSAAKFDLTRYLKSNDILPTKDMIDYLPDFKLTNRSFCPNALEITSICDAYPATVRLGTHENPTRVKFAVQPSAVKKFNMAVSHHQHTGEYLDSRQTGVYIRTHSVNLFGYSDEYREWLDHL